MNQSSSLTRPSEARPVHFLENSFGQEALLQIAALVEASDDAIISLSTEGDITSWNPGAERLYGYSAAEVTGHHISLLLPPNRAEEGVAMSRAIVQGENFGPLETARLTKSGRLVDVSISVSPVRDMYGYVIGAAGITRNISARKGAEEALRESEDRYRTVFNGAPIGITLSGLDGRTIVANQAYQRMVGYTEEELRQICFTDITHPDDIDIDLDLFAEAVAGRRPGYELTKRYIRKDGQEIWVKLTVVILRNAEGSPTFDFAMVEDISERKHVEDELATSQERYRSVVEASLDGIVTTDLIGTITFANQQAATLLGFESPNMLVGRVNLEFIAPEDQELAIREMTDVLARGVARNVHVALVRTNGDSFPAEISASLSVDSSGQPVGIMAMMRDVTERTAHEAQLQHLALHDPLTGLPNRTLLSDRLHQVLTDSKRNGEPAALLVMDLDHFKEINDTFGHHFGDQILHEIGIRLKGALRDSDTVARLGGDEFALVLPGTDRPGAQQIATKLVAALEQPHHLGDMRYHVGACFGIAQYPEHGEDEHTLLRHADVAMYRSKQSNSGWTVYDAEYDSYSPTKLALVGELRDAIGTNQLILHYQPKMDLVTGEPAGVEALVRWDHPQHGLIPPDEFIPLAETMGLMPSLTRRIIEEAVQQCRLWHDAGLLMPVAVNLSARSLQDVRLPATIAFLVRKWAVSPVWLTLEITEGAIIAEPDTALPILRELREMGIQISIDDFGTGYSSLGYLKRLPVDEVKIDRSFVMDMLSDPNAFAIVRAVVELGHNLGLRVVAEGVEDLETLQKLRAMRCDRAQGYHIGRPMRAGEILPWIDTLESHARSLNIQKSILAVDDNPNYLKLVQVLLTAEGYDVNVAVDADQTLQLLQGKVPDLILMDVRLANASGLDLVREIRSRFALKDTAILAITSGDRSSDEKDARDAGCDGFAPKPDKIDDLLCLVQKHVT